MTRSLPPRPTLEHLKKEAKALLKAHKAGNAKACDTLRLLRRFAKASDEEILSADLALSETQFALAMDYGFKSWDAMKAYVESASGEDSVRRDYSQLSLRGNGHTDDSFSLTFVAAAKLLGRDAPYEKVFALSTNPFAPAFFLPEQCPSFWHQRGRAHGLDILAKHFGLRYEVLQLPETDIDPVREQEKYRDEYLAKCAPILRDVLHHGHVVIIENGWASPKGGPFVSWMWFGMVEEVRDDGTILGATLNGQHDNHIADLGRCWALSAGEADMGDMEAERASLEFAVRRIRAEKPPFEPNERMAYGLVAMDAWMKKMDHVPFCEACVESAPDPDRARGWTCARDCAASVCEGAAAASVALPKWASHFTPKAGEHLQSAGERYKNIDRLLRPFTTWDNGRGYHAMMGNLQKQKQHAEDVLRPIMDEFATAADEIEKAQAAME
ncbi:MAG: hypothetical protein SVV80_07885 [Planctomycetota bacterium]|nr:hypothetical protein [Planctomycetota bacterium]